MEGQLHPYSSAFHQHLGFVIIAGDVGNWGSDMPLLGIYYLLLLLCCFIINYIVVL